mmetsp:Transcript_21474/g.23832  ORF Transcript_21474/g.23832 Transcript_21474/m.23832 type:complete len:352 (+) Transcript_21474:275-1330(+)|eukprot:CAMPEP_0194148036 /NCGR_PEP_ID=MMETSP0152-20130528/29669_1 /TAXON_ID=1049557 /ORGANISM="Thalassiothrix antarctica, Strain L6-D1" /LENGTH=351 /DNA_ID=CAMNT_0038849275 /DNA_START=260 /DNA_END=1315 /DNA_ORIENTATION=+
MNGRDRAMENAKQLFCGGVAGATAKTATAPFSRLTILFQVHSMVTSKQHRPKFALSFLEGVTKIVERGGIVSLWRGNGTSVLHRFPYSAINFFVYENMLKFLHQEEEVSPNLTSVQLARRLSLHLEGDKDEQTQRSLILKTNNNTHASTKFLAGAMAGSIACIACYPLDLVRTRLTTQFEGFENYHGMSDAFRKISQKEGINGFYSGLGPTLLVAVPNFALSYTVYGTLKEHALDDELFYNLRKVDVESGESKLGFWLTLACGATSGSVSTLVTFPFDTIRRRMQIQNLHVATHERLTSIQQATLIIRKQGYQGLYQGLTPELMKVIPMVGTMFLVYEWTKDMLNVDNSRR